MRLPQRLSFLTALALGACQLFTEEVDAPPTATASFPPTVNRNLDLLFVIDNSGSMGEEQVTLASQFPLLVEALGTVEGGLPDLHLGVISTNVGTGGISIGGCSSASRPLGDDGNLLTNACAGLTAPFLSDVALADGSRARNYTGELSTQFACMAQLGISGCGFEQPLESMLRALQPERNPGFVRPEANLAIVFIGDEDDCSAQDPTLFTEPQADLSSPLGPRTSFRCHEFGVVCDDDPNPRALGVRTGCRPREDSPYIAPVARYVDFVRSLKADPGAVMVAGIIGHVDAAASAEVVVDPDGQGVPTLAPSCASGNGIAFPGFRLRAFLDAFPDRNHAASICSDDYTSALAGIAASVKRTLGVPCFELDLADRDAAAAGVQPECTVLHAVTLDGVRQATPIPACDGTGSATCWRLEADAAVCPLTPDHRVLRIDPVGAPLLGGRIEATCVVNR